jgi:hypothetical protein
MSADAGVLKRVNLRGADANSLLRLYDRTRLVVGASGTRLERERAGQAMRRIAAELGRRGVRP